MIVTKALTLLDLIEEGKNPCQVCRDWRRCVYNEGKEWYTYPEIRYCPYQVMWVIEKADTLRAGNWPPNPEGTGYIDSAIHTGYSSEAYYTKAVRVIADVSKRLDRTGVDGKLLKEQVENGKTIDKLEPESRSALMYIKGWRAKRMSYNAWKKWNKLYQKVK